MSIALYEHLEPLAPFLGGDWRWLTYAAIVAPLGLAAWGFFGSRWKPDGVRRCSRCGHQFDPSLRIDEGAGTRCSECGAPAPSERAVLRRRGRRRLVGAAVLSALLLALPLLAWHSVHVFLARTLLPRWMTAQRAEFPGGLVLVEEVDPLQEWLGWDPNPADGAWHGHFEDPPEDSASADLTAWPERRRLRAWRGSAAPVTASYVGPFTFGAEFDSAAEPGRMPPVGAPGFGGDIDGDGTPDIVVGEMNVGSGGGIEWFRIECAEGPDAQGAPPTVVGIGHGVFRRVADGACWCFMMRCHGFRYTLTPGYALQDPAVACSWDPAARAWTPDARLMRRPPDRARLADCAERARQGYLQCERAATEVEQPPSDAGGAPSGAGVRPAIQDLRDGRMPIGGFLPCPGVVAAMTEGALELVTSGNGTEWEGWVRLAWPSADAGGFRDRYLAAMRGALETCECSEFLRTLDARAGAATGRVAQ